MISFIIPAHNEERHIEACIRSVLLACQGQEFEIVVVADTCSDETVKKARSFGAVVRVLEVEHRQISATRHAGAMASEGEFLFFLDADTQTRPALVEEALACMRAGCVGGGAVFLFDGQVPFYARILEVLFAWLCRLARLAGGCSLFCRREAYLAIGGFDLTLFAGEELRFCQEMKKLGQFRVVRTPVLTSGRKLRLYRAGELWPLLRAYLSRGDSMLQDRQGLDLWYARRSES